MPDTTSSLRSVDQRAFRDAMGRFTTGVTVVTTAVDGQVFGMTANGFMSVSLDPPLVVVSVARRAKMHDALTRSGRYGVNFLCADQEHVSAHFAGRPAQGFAPDFETVEGIPVLHGALAQVVARVSQSHVVGDHTLYVGEVLHFLAQDGADPLVFHGGRYRDLVQVRPEYPDAWAGFALDPHVP
jgi:flavin reductase (DIM6/NTAB) family NADH-FMN oxidoreductase RutF